MENLKNLTKKVIPYICEDFITIPLWEEGNYTLQVNFWQKFKDVAEFNKYNKILIKLFKVKQYEVYILATSRVIYNIYISPKLKYLKNGSFEYLNPNWSVEEIIELFSEYLINKSK